MRELNLNEYFMSVHAGEDQDEELVLSHLAEAMLTNTECDDAEDNDPIEALQQRLEQATLEIEDEHGNIIAIASNVAYLKIDEDVMREIAEINARNT